MKALKIIGIVLVSIVLIVVVVGYLQPETMQIERSTIVKSPVSVTFDQVNNLEKRVLWSPWEKVDTTMATTMGDKTSGVGASYSWVSATQGEGSLTYREVVENEKVVSDLQFGKQGTAVGQITFSEAPDGTKVTWAFESQATSNPFQRLAMSVLAPQLEMMFDQGLASLKAQAESAEPAGSSNNAIVETTVESFKYISVMDSAYIQDMAAHYEKSYGILGQFAAQNELQITGMPLSITHRWDEETFFGVFEPAMPISGEAESTDQVMVKDSYAGKVLKATHMGSYESVGSTWDALMAKVASGNYTENGYPWEVYVTDPGQEPDTTKWITEIYMPVK